MPRSKPVTKLKCVPIPSDLRFKDRTGWKNGRLEVIGYAGDRAWYCRCDCGVVVSVATPNVGKTKSCGCLASEVTRERSLKHGQHSTKEYKAWGSMKQRCLNPKSAMFQYYGGCGVSVCNKWIDSFDLFLKDMGLSPSIKHSVGRINNNGDYEPGNCRWETPKQQIRNRRNTKHLTVNGVARPLGDWSDEYGISTARIHARISRGWCDTCAVTIALQPAFGSGRTTCTHR